MRCGFAWSDSIFRNLNKILFERHKDIATLDVLKADILSVASNMAGFETRSYGFWVSSQMEYFETGRNYFGVMCVMHKTSSQLVFTVNLTNDNGDLVVVGYTNGTWNFNPLNSKITNYVELVEISDLNISPREANKTYHFTAKHTASGVPNANFDCIAGYLFTEKDASWFGTEIVFTVIGIFYRKLDSGILALGMY